MNVKADVKMMILQTDEVERLPANPQKLGERDTEQISPHSLQKETTLSIP